MTDITLDEWLIADNPSATRRYLIHTVAPRFICEVIFDEDLDVDLHRFSYGRVNNEESFIGFVWLDEAATGDKLLKLLASGDDALTVYESD